MSATLRSADVVTRRHRPSKITTAFLGMVALAAAIIIPVAPQSAAAETLTVAQAIAGQDGSAQSVSGHIVGQPVSAGKVITSDHPNDYAISLADKAGETDTDKMVHVQLPSALRADWGLKSNGDKLGAKVTVTGTLTSYFSHPGIKSTTAIEPAGSSSPTATPTEDPTATPTEDPTATPTEDPTATPTEDPTPTEEPTATATEPSDPTGYYAEAEGKTGEELKTALHGIISEQDKLSYDEVWDALKDTDEDPDNSSNVILLYSGRSQAKSAHGGDQNDWNREHVWAKSHGDFGTATGPGTDIHHLRPTDTTVNSTRNNLDFDNGGEPVKEAEECKYDSDSFEPRDEVKGDVARMIFYMAVRYDGTDGWADLEPNDKVENNSDPFMGKVSVLKQWNEQDPPSAFEKRRNDVIFEKYQHNRNPFIDHPEWVDAIYG
ncbi:endonuclease [Propionibacteriaceae bacterium Y1700]|uniref:endonuclease n=1 Tax=Microlunatus sp. Y1700 TaxID=3418487 RepID=UPI003DA7025F